MKFSIVICLFGVVLVAGCSSSGDNSTADTGSETNTVVDSSVTGIASATANDSPVALDIDELQQTFDSITSTEPVPVQDTDTVNSLLQKVGL